MSQLDGIPEYAAALAAYHAAFAPELRGMIDSLPIGQGGRVLDLACGDGSYASLLAGRVGSSGLICAVDLAPDYLKLAADRSRSGPAPDRVGFAVADLDHLPFEPASFDLAWCAQSFYSLPDPVGALKTLAGLVRPGGVVAVLESDTVHQVLLPWPIEVELTVRTAEFAAFAAETRRPQKYYVGRRLRLVFEEAGLRDVRRTCWSMVRSAPLDDCTRAYLVAYLQELERRIAPHLAPEAARAVRPYFDPDSEEYLPDRRDLDFTVLEHFVRAGPPSP